MIKIKCPNCGAILNVKAVPGLNDKLVRCPICEEKHPFSNYKEVKSVSTEDETDYESHKANSAKVDDETEINTGEGEETVITTCGYLLDIKTKKKYSLKNGVNYIGRSATSTPERVNVRIETSDMGFSRSHLCLEAVLHGGVRKYKVYNDACKNPTFLNGEKIDKKDVLFLKENDIIKSSSVELQFLLK